MLNLMQISKNNSFHSCALGSTHAKFDVWPWPKTFLVHLLSYTLLQFCEQNKIERKSMCLPITDRSRQSHRAHKHVITRINRFEIL